MKDETVNKILSETKHGYDMISQKFSQTRKHFWRNLEFIGDYVRDGDNVLDYGCGNGRLLELIGNKKINYVGLDISQQLIEDAKIKYDITEFDSESESNSIMAKSIEFKKTSPIQTSLAFPQSFFNSIYSIAVFHHFPSAEYRESIVKELFRVTKPGGYVVITVWSLWPAFVSLQRGKQKKYYINIFKNWIDKLKGKSQLDWNDCYISFTNNEGKKFNRYHHAFTKRGLNKLFSQVGFSVEKCEIVDGRNIVLVAKKH